MTYKNGSEVIGNEIKYLLIHNGGEINIPIDFYENNTSVTKKKTNLNKYSIINKLIKCIIGISWLVVLCLVVLNLIIKYIGNKSRVTVKYSRSEPKEGINICKPEEIRDVKISIIIPAYNTAEFLDRSINSVLNQTLKDIELILINDASTDNTTDVLRKYEKDPCVTVINRGRNDGVCVSRNLGLAVATGELIGFHDSDDSSDPEFFENLYSYYKSYDVIEGIFIIYQKNVFIIINIIHMDLFMIQFGEEAF